MEEPGSPPEGKWNIQDFSLDDLLDALNLPPNPMPSQVTDAANSVISRMRAQGQMNEARFFEQAKAELLSAIEDDGLDKEHNEQETTMGNWWSNEYPAQGDQTQSEKATSRHQKVQFFPNSHFQMNQERLGVNQTYSVPVMQGTINPNQRNVTRRMVFIDSSQKHNLSSGLNTDFTLDLSEPLTNVLQMHLHSIHLPNTWYTFSPHLGNTTFDLSFSGTSYCANISAGNYSGPELAKALQEAIHDVAPGANDVAPGANDIFKFEPKTNKMTIANDFDASMGTVVFTFYSPTGLQQATGAGSQCSQTACKSMFRNQNLGWSLGLRDLQTHVAPDGTVTYANPPGGDFTLTIEPHKTSKIVFTPSAPVDTYGPKSFFLVVDDYNQNRLNKGVVSMTDRPTKLSVPTYVEPGLVDSYSGDISCASVIPPPGMTGPTRAERVVKTYPRRLTQAQIYTANEILANRNTPDFRVPPVSADNVLAVIPLSGIQRTARLTYDSTATPPTPKDLEYAPATPFIASGTDLLVNERVYFGPVDIERMRVKLIDDRGNIVDLNSMDWSLTLCVEELYQY